MCFFWMVNAETLHIFRSDRTDSLLEVHKTYIERCLWGLHCTLLLTRCHYCIINHSKGDTVLKVACYQYSISLNLEAYFYLCRCGSDFGNLTFIFLFFFVYFVLFCFLHLLLFCILHSLAWWQKALQYTACVRVRVSGAVLVVWNIICP